MLRTWSLWAVLACGQPAMALRLPRLAPTSHASSAGLVSELASFLPVVAPLPRRCALRMQEVQESDFDFMDGYMLSDPETGERTSVTLAAKEKLYLDCLDAYYNENGKALLPDDDYEKLKLDLDFEGSPVSTYSADEIKFIIANKRYSMGKAILSDKEYDELRLRLKTAGSFVVLHEAPACDPESGFCKNDMRVDVGKQRLLYLPGVVGGMVLFCEVSFWTLHLDPIFSILLGAIPVYFAGVWFTENIFAQDPLVASTACPNCDYLLNVYFGDLLSVQTDGIAGPGGPPGPEVEIKCPNCKAALVANRDKMVITGEVQVTA